MLILSIEAVKSCGDTCCHVSKAGRAKPPGERDHHDSAVKQVREQTVKRRKSSLRTLLIMSLQPNLISTRWMLYKGGMVKVLGCEC